MTLEKKIVAVKNPVKLYRGRLSGRKFFVRFDDGINAMFDEQHATAFQVGDQIEFESEPSGPGWVTISKKATVNKLQTVNKSEEIEFNMDLEIGYVSKEKQRGNKKYVTIPSCKWDGRNYVGILDLDLVVDKDILKGYGHVSGKAVIQGGRMTFERIDAFTPTIETHTVEQLMSEVYFSSDYIRLVIQDEKIYLNQRDLPFATSPIMNAVKSNFKGVVKLHIRGRRRGSVKKVRGIWCETPWLEALDREVDFSDADLPNIKQIVDDYESELAYKDLLRRLKNISRFRSFSSIKKTFARRGFTITDADIKKMFYHKEYDAKCFEILEKMSSDIYVNNSSFIFVIREGGYEYRVVEKPSIAAATYIFDDKLPMAALLKAIQHVTRSTLRADKSVQQEMGFAGFAKHNQKQHGSWRWKIKEVVEDDFASQLEQKFIF